MSKTTITHRIGAFFVRHNIATLVLTALLTVFFAAFIGRVKMKTPTIDLFPKNHSFVKTYVEYENVFGGANVIALSLEVKNGDVFNTATLEKMRRITKNIELLPAVNNYSVLSLAQRKVKITTVDEITGFRSEPVMWPDVPQTKEGVEELRNKIYSSGRYHGSLVSSDDKALMILAGFFEKGLQSASDSMDSVVRQIAESEGRDPAEAVAALKKTAETEVVEINGKPLWTPNDTIFDAIDKICRAEEDANHVVQMIGRPVLLGWIARNYPQLIYIFLLTVFAIIACLTLYFRAFFGVLIPTLTAALSAIWGLGFLGLLNYLAEVQKFDIFGLGSYYFNPLVIVVPFIISARALSHSVQLIERYTEEFDRCKDRKVAAAITFDGLFKPAVLSIVLDAVSVFIVAVTPIPLMQKLALMGGFWILSIIGTNVIFNPVFLTVLPPMKKTVHTGAASPIDRLLGAIIRSTTEKHQKLIIGVTLLIFVLGLFFAKNLVIGDVNPGTPMLWPGSQYNKDTVAMYDRFQKTEMLSIVVEGKERDQIKSPQILMTMEKFQRELEAMPEVSFTASIAELIPEIVKTMHGSHPKWELIPENLKDSGFYLGMIYQGAEPGDLDRFLDRSMKDANLTVYLTDHKGTTLRSVIAKAQDFIAKNPLEDAHFRLAGQMGGLLAAVNETIVSSEMKVTIYAFLFVFIVCVITYRSFLAGIYFLLPTAISNYLTYALMGAFNIGLDVNSLPVVALGVGLGVDYGLYVVGRIEEEYAVTGDLVKSTAEAIMTAGRAVFFTAATMVAGIIFWAFSFLRFQAEMGILLAFWMIISMLGGLILLPALVITFKPRFVTRRGDAMKAAAAKA